MLLTSDDDGNIGPRLLKTVRRCVPRLALKLFLAVPLFVATYVVVGTTTREYGTKTVANFLNVKQGGGNPGYVAPFILEYWTMTTNGRTADVRMDYYIWIFGWVIETPVSRTKSYATDSFDMDVTSGIGDFVRETSISTFVNEFDN